MSNETALVSRDDSAHEVPVHNPGFEKARKAHGRSSPNVSLQPATPAARTETSVVRKRISGLALPEEFFFDAPAAKSSPSRGADGDTADQDDFELSPQVAKTATPGKQSKAAPAVARKQAEPPAKSNGASVPPQPAAASRALPAAASAPAAAPAPAPKSAPTRPAAAELESAATDSLVDPDTDFEDDVAAMMPIFESADADADDEADDEADEIAPAQFVPRAAAVVVPPSASVAAPQSAPQPAPRAVARPAAKEPAAVRPRPAPVPRQKPPVRREGRTLKIFLSATIDVAEERVLARRVLERLGEMFSEAVDVELAFWEHEPLLEMDTFLNERFLPEEADVVICVLWSRLGHRIPQEELQSGEDPFASGTEYECFHALEGTGEGFRELLVYRKTAPPSVDKLDEFQVLKLFAERKALDQFVNEWFLDADARHPKAFRPFQDAGEFVETLQSDLADTIGRIVSLRELELRESENGPVCWWKQGSPFLGLAPFGFQHAPLYLIQTRAACDVLHLLRKQAAEGRAFVLVVGGAGCGKSSFVSAGVLPILTEPGVIEGVGLWRRAEFSPCDAPDDMVEGLAATLLHADVLPELAADGLTTAKLSQLLGKNPPAAGRLMQAALARGTAELRPASGVLEAPQARLVLTIDGLEQMFTNDAISEEDRRSLIAALVGLARSGAVWILATLRSEFYPRCQEYPDLLALKEGNGHYDLPLPSPADIEKMVRMRSEAAGLAVEKNPRTGVWLDDELCDAAAFDRARLYRLEFMLSLLYECRNDQNALPYAVFENLGRLENVISTRVAAVFDSLSLEARAALPGVLDQLTIGGSTGAIANRAAPFERLRASLPAKELVNAFVEAGLLLVRRPMAGAATVHTFDEVLQNCRGLQAPPAAAPTPASAPSTSTILSAPQPAPQQLVDHDSDPDHVLDFPEPHSAPSHPDLASTREPPAEAPQRHVAEPSAPKLSAPMLTAVETHPVAAETPSPSAVHPHHAEDAPTAAPSHAVALAAPVASTDIELACGNCHGRLRVETPGSIVICPHCGIPLQTPKIAESAAAEPVPQPRPRSTRVRKLAVLATACALLAGLSYKFLVPDSPSLPLARLGTPPLTNRLGSTAAALPIPRNPAAPISEELPARPAPSVAAIGAGEPIPQTAEEKQPQPIVGTVAPAPVKPPEPRPVAVVPSPAQQAPGAVETKPGSASTPAQTGLTDEKFVNSIDMSFRRIPAGEFVMGSPVSEAERGSDEKPHRVRITRPFYLGTMEVTQAQYQQVANKNPSSFKGRNLPVENVTWQDAVDFCRRLSALPEERAARRKYRLPTEAEWEYACRAGSQSVFPRGNALSSQDENFDGNHPYGGAPKGPDLAGTARVGSYAPNAFGLHDMPGNVSEWCADYFDKDAYNVGAVDDPVGPSSGLRRITRGGNWLNGAQRCRSAARGSELPRNGDSIIGFRVVVVADDE